MSVLIPDRVPKRGISPKSLANLRPPWRPGEPGNPSGKRGTYGEALRICRDHTPDASRKLVELMSSPDERVGFMAAKEIWDRAWGKPKEARPDEEEARPVVDTSRLSEEQKQALLAVFRSATKAQGE